MLMKQWLTNLKYLLNKWNPYLLNLSYQVFAIHQKSEGQKNDELLSITVGTCVVTYFIY